MPSGRTPSALSIGMFSGSTWRLVLATKIITLMATMSEDSIVILQGKTGRDGFSTRMSGCCDIARHTTMSERRWHDACALHGVGGSHQCVCSCHRRSHRCSSSALVLAWPARFSLRCRSADVSGVVWPGIYALVSF